MAIFYPRKQTVIIFVVCLLAVSGAIYYAKRNSSAGQNTAVLTAKPTPTVVDTQTAGADNSGDWKKQFLVDASDTPSTSPSKKDGATAKIAPQTDTDKLGQQFFTSYMELKQANLLDNTDLVNQTADTLVTSSLATEQPKTYSQNDLHITEASDMQTLNRFSSSVAGIIETYSVKEGESAILQDYLTNSDAATLKKLDPIISTYKTMIMEFLATPTPRTMADPELQLVNAFSSLLFAAQSLRASDNDTVKGLAGVTMHVAAVQSAVTAFQNLHSALDAEGVSFTFNQVAMGTFLQ